MTFQNNMIKIIYNFIILILLHNICCIMYIFKTYFSKYLYTCNIANVCVYIVINMQILMNFKSLKTEIMKNQYNHNFM